MALSLEKLKTKQQIIESKLTRIEEFVKNFKTRDPIEQLIVRKKTLNDIFIEFDDNQTQIELLDSEEIISKTRDTFEIRYFNVLSTIEQVSKKKMVTTKVPSPKVEPELTQTNIKLPEIPLPTFSGSYSDWLPYYDTFTDLIHNNKSITDCMKFHYLKRSLMGEASKIIETLTISNINYSNAWDLLKKRYNNTRLIVQDHVHNILKASSITKPSSYALRNLVDNLKVNVEALKLQSVPVGHWDALLIPIITAKLDYQTNKEWQSKLTQDIPKYSDFEHFLEKRCELLESIQTMSMNNQSSFKTPKTQVKHTQDKKILTTSHANTSNYNKSNYCVICKNSHSIYQCSEFLSLNPRDRLKRVKELSLCVNCLRKNHTTSECRSTFCRQCNKRHHTLLHFENDRPQNNPPIETLNENPDSNIQSTSNIAAEDNSVSNYNSFISTSFHQVLLSTAIVLIKHTNGKFMNCRVLLDVGSQSNFITKELCDKLNLPTKVSNHTIAGINQVKSQINSSTKVVMKSRISSFEIHMDCLVTTKITQDLPLISFKKSTLQIPKDIELADPDFNINNPIDMLIGAQLFWDLLIMEQIKLNKAQPIWQNTYLGWVVGGSLPMNCSKNQSLLLCNISVDNYDQLEEQLAHFFEIEQCEDNNFQSPDQHICETHFKSTFSRDMDGRFVIKLPLLNDPPDLGSSFNNAKKCLLNLERKFKTDTLLKKHYIAFMREYQLLDHMEIVKNPEFPSTLKYNFLPHHGVYKNSNKDNIRVVFNASHKTTNGLSLNDNLIKGPVIQDDLFMILVRFRTYHYILTGDITKFYRQIRMSPEHCNFQMILWRESTEQEIQCFRLKTLTYGTKPASFLASRCLKQLSLETLPSDPKIADILEHDFYMDDLLTGSNNISELIGIREKITNVLSKAQLPICKWVSNNSEILPNASMESIDQDFNFDKSNCTKTLGLLWDTKNDMLKYSVDSEVNLNTLNKRTLLSEISKIFDPLGLLGPFITLCKILLQSLWSLKLDWDEPLPHKIQEEWFSLSNSRSILNNIRISRSIIPFNVIIKYEIHGFADASMKAYGAAIYLRTLTIDNKYFSYLLCSKSRVAPIKTVTLPRLELCAARLLARLTDKVLKALKLTVNQTFYWTDSTIVIAWISAPANTWNVFVSNRVSEIQALTNNSKWYHVPSDQNPADIVSRGCTPEKLINSNLWFNGPAFLELNYSQWPHLDTHLLDDIPESKKTSHVSLLNSNTYTELPCFTKFSSLRKLTRVIAYIYRFFHNTHSSLFKVSGCLTVGELENATFIILKNIQATCYREEIEQLSKDKELHKKSKILSLNPFLDQRGILRVGGRLINAKIEYDSKHQILLPSTHYVTELFIVYEHVRNLHAGILGTLSAIRQRFWIINGRSTVRRVIHKCFHCFRVRPLPMIQKMGNLPSARVELIRPFLRTGIDYAGPFFIKSSLNKQSKTIKAYICLFVCMATKAVHLELVSSLTTEAFLNTFRRFISRRGYVIDIFSDNGSNFIGAKKELDLLFNFLNSEQFKNHIIDTFSLEKINWHFIPPHAPNMGGLWEVNIKSVKRHLKTYINTDTKFTFEEMSTLLCRIEACLNSRPITPLSSDPKDLTYLTPGHFLIGDILTCPVDPDITNVRLNSLSRWQRMEQVRQRFWRRWSREYLTTLQHRSKWHLTNRDLHIGMMVLLIEDNIPPQMWKLGRILEFHPGSDGVTRVVTVKTARGNFKRSIRKLAPLPRQDDI